MTPADRADAVFDALADRTRRSLFRSVVENGPVSATDLAEGLPISRQAVAKHLQALARAGLVRSARSGRHALYEADPEPLDEADRWIAEVSGAWDKRLHRLRHHFEADRPTED